MHLNDYEWSIPFEFAHMLSFSVSILYTLVAVVSIRRLQYTKYRFAHIFLCPVYSWATDLVLF